MDYLSNADFFENVNFRKLLTTKTITYAKNASNQINDIVIDFSQCSNYVIDLRGATYIGSNPTIQVAITGGLQINARNRLKVIQDTTNPLPANLNIEFVSSATIKYVEALHYLCNVSGSVIAFEFDYVDVSGGVSMYVPIGITTSSTPYSEDTDYTSTAIISTGDAYVEALSKLDAIIARLVPPTPPYINDPSISVTLQQTPTSLHRLSDGLAVSVITSAEPTFIISQQVYNSGGQIASYFNNTVDGVIDLSTATLSNNSLSIVKSKDSSNFYDVFSQILVNSANKNGGVLANQESTHTVNVQHNDGTTNRGSSTVMFRKCRSTAFPIIANPTDVELIVSALNKQVSGLSVADMSAVLSLAAKYKNVTFNAGDNTGFYPAIVGELSSAGFITTSVNVSQSDFSDMIANSPDTALITTNINLLANQFIESGLSVTVKSKSPQGTSVGVSVDQTALGKKILVDSVTNVNSGSVNYVFDHTLSLLSTDTLMIINGRIRYPYNDWTAFIDGLNYSTITGWRKIESKSINAAGFSRIRVTLPSPIGFDGALENSTNYRMEVTRSDKPGEIYDGNSAYDGVGVVAHTEGCLLLANSTASEKVITFGEVLPAGVTATITIYLNDNTKSFGQLITYVAF